MSQPGGSTVAPSDLLATVKDKAAEVKAAVTENMPALPKFGKSIGENAADTQLYDALGERPHDCRFKYSSVPYTYFNLLSFYWDLRKHLSSIS
jgi:hypothetical protein